MTVTTNILQRTFRMRHGDSTGTCFTVDVENRRYLVTARHLVRSINSDSYVLIEHCGEWKTVAVTLVGHGDGEIDITVLAPQVRFGTHHSLVVTSGGLPLGAEVYFLGFPYEFRTDSGELNRGFPFPLVKRATVSALQLESGLVLLDGHNNPGFSGGASGTAIETGATQLCWAWFPVTTPNCRKLLTSRAGRGRTATL